MRICLHIDPSRLLRWHLWLRQALSELPGVDVTDRFSAQAEPLPRSCDLLLELERTIYGRRGLGATDRVALIDQRTHDAKTKPDLVIDLAGHGASPAGCRVLTPSFNGLPGEVGLMAAILDGQDLVIELHDTDRPGNPWRARPASTDRQMVAASLDGALSCTVALILKAVPGAQHPVQEGRFAHTDRSVPRVGGRRALTWALSVAATKAARLIGIIATGGPTWSIGWRRDLAFGLLDRFDATFSVLKGSGKSFLADPFPFRYRGRDYIFAEEYPYATGRGVISVIPFDSRGLPGAPRVVLEEPHHLSYPFVFAQDGQIWMIPESGAAKSVCLYRAVEFPDRWEREAVLLQDFEAFDATLWRHGGRFWLFACLRKWTSTSWDMLGLYHAERLAGAWTAHADNPVLFDATLARPAGALFEHDGRWLRPVQDCAHGYGGAINICRIDALGETEFAQTPVGRIQCGPYRCHTFNRHAGLECIDVFGPRGLSEVEATYDASPEVLRDVRMSGPPPGRSRQPSSTLT